VVKRVFSAILAASLVILSCGGSAAPAPASSAPASAAASASAKPTNVALKVAYSNLTNDNLSQWYAKEKGIFAENALDVELVAIDGSKFAAQNSPGVPWLSSKCSCDVLTIRTS